MKFFVSLAAITWFLLALLICTSRADDENVPKKQTKNLKIIYIRSNETCPRKTKSGDHIKMLVLVFLFTLKLPHKYTNSPGTI
jgi:hypothetical protein